MPRVRLEYYGEQLYLQQIARKEELVASTLMKCYRESGDIYTAVERCKQISRPTGYIKKLEYNGEMLTLHAIAEMEEISKEPLKRYYLELGDLYEAVELCKQNARGEVERISYNGQNLSINAIAKLEGVGVGSLRTNYLKTGDIYEAVKVTKQNERKKIEYNGEMLTLNSIAKTEKISCSRLARIYSITGNIYQSVKLSKTTTKVRKEQIQTIEYNGEEMTLEQIAQKEGIDYDTLRKYYRKTQDIYDAIQIYLQDLKRKVKKIEYINGEKLAISVIAQREGIGITTLTDCYKNVGDIFEAVRICKEDAQNRKIKAEQRQLEKESKKILYKGMPLQLKEIAQMEGLDTKSLNKYFNEKQDIYIAVFRAKYEKRRKEVVEIQGLEIDLYDMSLLIGVKYSDLINLLNDGMSINEIKEKYANHEIAGENIKLRSGRTLLEFCTREGLKFSFMYRAISTYAKTIQKATTEYRANNKSIPTKWIYEKYETILNQLGLPGIQSLIVVKDLQDGRMSLEEALEKFVLTKNARKYQKPIEWCEALYGLVQSRKIYGEEFQSEVQLDESEKAFINECETELLELKRRVSGNLDPVRKKHRGALIEQGEIRY